MGETNWIFVIALLSTLCIMLAVYVYGVWTEVREERATGDRETRSAR